MLQDIEQYQCSSQLIHILVVQLQPDNVQAGNVAP